MVCHGDELGRTQHGNNNAYCQDSELTWINWEAVDGPLVEFTAAVARLRAEHPTFRRSKFFLGKPVRREEGDRLPDIVWLRPDGETMVPEDWDTAFGRSVAVFLNGNAINGVDRRGQAITDAHFLLYFNAHDGEVTFRLPSEEYAPGWDVLIDTSGDLPHGKQVLAGSELGIASKSLAVLRAHEPTPLEADHSVAASLAALAESEGRGMEAELLEEPAKASREAAAAPAEVPPGAAPPPAPAPAAAPPAAAPAGPHPRHRRPRSPRRGKD
jgi:glycogen operon protein